MQHFFLVGPKKWTFNSSSQLPVTSPVTYARLEPRATESQSRSPVGGDAKERVQKPILAVTWVET